MRKNRPVIEMDNVDTAMLRLLQVDGALSNTTLGEKLSLNVVPCSQRRKRLEDAGVITGYQVNIDRRAVGMNVFAFVLVALNMHYEKASDDFEAIINNCQEVLACHEITGNADYLLQIVAPDLDSYGEFIEWLLRCRTGISVVESSLALREVKFSSRVPVPQLPIGET